MGYITQCMNLKGGFGSWNDGGTSGGSVRLMAEGSYEMWFSGAKMRKNGRILPREEDVGVAYSTNGVDWVSGAANPLARHSAMSGPVRFFPCFFCDFQ